MSQWLTIIGMGEDGIDGLGAKARLALETAEVLVGSKRLLGMLPTMNCEFHEWPQPFSAVVSHITAMRGRQTVVLATGDPLNFGVARKILEFIAAEDVTIIPHLSSFSLAAARMRWSLPDCDCITIHGRPAASVEAFIQPDARLLMLTENETSPAEVCRRLAARGFPDSVVTVLENMGGTNERVTRFVANELPATKWSALHVLAVHCIAGTGAKVWSRVAGLPDEAFEHDGKITKREVRAATLAALSPAPDQLLWDVGAGSGSVGIEWMRSTRGCKAIAIEPDTERCKSISINADQLGTPGLKLVHATAPAAYHGLQQPDAVFIGGGIDAEGVFEGAWHALKPGGNLVANTVTLEGDRRLITLQEHNGGDLVRMDVSTLTSVGDLRAMRPRMSVLQWRIRKP